MNSNRNAIENLRVISECRRAGLVICARDCARVTLRELRAASLRPCLLRALVRAAQD